MDFQRIILIGALLFTLLMIWEAWQEDYVRPKTEPAVASESAPAGADTPAAPDAPPRQATAAPADTPAGPASVTSATRVNVTTDVLRAEIDTVGGDVRRIELLAYPVAADKPDQPVVLLNDRPGELFIAQTGLLPGASQSLPAPSHHARFTAERANYTLAEGDDSVTVRLAWRQDAVEVIKTLTFRRGDYVVDVAYEVNNGAAEPWTGHVYRQLQRTRPTDTGRAFAYTYTGGVISTPDDKYEKVDFDDMDDADLSRTATGGWAAMIQHYFLAAWIPPQDNQQRYYTKSPENRYILGLVGETATAPAGGSASFDSRLYVGPKIQDRLAAIAPGLELTVDYGILTIIAKPLHWLLDLFYSLLGNWGFAIIALTVLVKGIFYKLSETSYKSMAHMRKVQPRLVALKEKYSDDREKLNQAMMKMYREEKINPLGGCLPILVQIPVFIALYWVLLESVELRHADFILWINDLSSADPYFVLPLIMGVTMLIQHRLNPTPMDPIQAKVMMILPVAFTFFFAFFPAGLVLYWVVNNTLSIAQQWYITRFVVKA